MGRELSASGARRFEKRFLSEWKKISGKKGKPPVFKKVKFRTPDGRMVSDIFRDKRLYKRIVVTQKANGKKVDQYFFKPNLDGLQAQLFRDGINNRRLRVRRGYRHYAHVIEKHTSLADSPKHYLGHNREYGRIPHQTLRKAAENRRLPARYRRLDNARNYNNR